jgi:hypothetical protein
LRDYFRYVRERAPGLQRIAANSGSSRWNLLVGERAEYVTGVPVSERRFDVLAVPMLILIAGGATFIPALSVSRTDPMRALRLE